jgi:Ca2+-binding EF-hand superfamily protein
MFRLRCASFAALLFVMFSAAAARAMPTAAQIRTAFLAMDTTRNAALNVEEWDRGSFALFHAADKNKNDRIDAEELQASNIAQDTFLLADLNKDGRLSVSEFMDLRRALFHITDIDRDDNLIYVEYELLIVMEQVGWTDRNHDGRIELSELRESLAKVVEQIDADHDGKLTAAETVFMHASQFKAFDKDADGTLSSAEFIAGYRAALLGG